MNDSYLQSTLREWWREFSQPVMLVALLGAGLIVGIVGPFNTSEELGLFQRLAFWTFMVVVTFAVASLTVQLLLPRLSSMGFLARTFVLGLCNSVTVSVTVLLINALVFNSFPTSGGLIEFLAILFLIVFIMTSIISFVEHNKADSAARQDTLGSAVPILSRLPIEKRGTLIALSVEDHYVRVKTSAGEEMLLMRLRDAIGEVGNRQGAQVHRSHWVAIDQVVSSRREKDRVILTLCEGSEIPVSRANVTKVKEAGLLP